MNCVLHFEDSKQVVDEFAEEHLWPQLEENHKKQQTEVQWIPYDDPYNPLGPAQEAQQRINANNWQRLVFVVDMDAIGKNTPEVQFGLDMLDHLAQLLHPRQQVPRTSLLSDDTQLICALTMFTKQFKSVFTNHWPQPIVNQVTFVEVNRKVRKIPVDTNRALMEVAAGGPRIVVASRLERGEWLASLIAKWL